MSEGRLSRWSRLKQEQRTPVPEPLETEPEGEDLSALPEAEALEKLGLPDPDTLEAGADFRAYLARAVPDAIRRRALRRLWLTNPVLANLDGLVDHGEDFTDAATVPSVLNTAFRVGQGMLARASELPDFVAESPDAEPGEEPGLPEPDQPEISQEIAIANDIPEQPQRPRRMRFERTG